MDHAATAPDVSDDLTRLVTAWLDLRTWRAFDVDDAGHVLAGHDDSGSVQLVELEHGSGRRTPLTALPGAVSGRYVPGERSVIVVHDEGGDENAQLSVLRLDTADGPALPAGLDDLEPLVHEAGVMHRLLDVTPGRVLYASNSRNRVDFDVHLLDLTTGVSTPVFSRGGSVTSASVSPDGARVVLVLASPTLPMSAHLVLVDLTDPDAEPLALTDPAEPGRHEGARWWPDGGSLVYATDADFDTTLVGRHDLADGRFSPVVAHDRWDVQGWLSPDGSTLLAETLVDGESRLGLHDPLTGRLRHQVDLPGGGTEEAGHIGYTLPEPVWSPDSRSVVLSFCAPGVPGDVLLVDASDGRVEALTDSSGPVPDVGLPSSHLVPTTDGEQVPCFVYPPTGDPDPDRAGSAVLVVHGGPEGQSLRTFAPVTQALAAAGHAVLVPNVRGSTGYGRRWYSLDDGPRRLDSVADLAALHGWLPSLGLDPDRAALWGGSYGGYMVLAGLTFQPELWAAGVDIVGISSLVTFLENTSPYRRAYREREYGRLETDRQMLEDASPLPRIDQIRAPLFVIHGANDPRVPLSEAEQLVEAVRSRGIECELRVYADEGHGLAKRANRLDAYPAAIAALSRWLEG